MKRSSARQQAHSLIGSALCVTLTVFFVLAVTDYGRAVRVSEERVTSTPPSRPAPTSATRRPATPPRRPPAKKEPEKQFVTIDFDNVDILLFIKFISEVTGKNFVVDEKVRGKVTVVSPTKVSVDEAYRVFESCLEVHGFTTVPAGSIVKVVPSVEARGKSIETRLREEAVDAEDKVVTRVIRLDYANPDELKKLFAPLISKSSVIVSYAPTGMLIVTDMLSNIKRLLFIIDAVDVVGIGEEISVVPLEYATASVLIKPLTTIFKTGGPRAGRKGAPSVAPVINIVADERTNSLIISASEYDTLRIKQLVELLDQEMPRGAGDIQVYYLQNADAEELAKVLTALPSQGTQARGKGVPVISKEVQIVADKATNSLVITANKQDYIALVDVIKKLDIARRMVYIESLIMEVSVTKTFELGVEWQAIDDVGDWEGREIGAFGGSRSGQGLSPTIDPGTGTASLPTGFSLGILGDTITISGVEFLSVAAVTRAYRKDSDVHILSNPQILTTDNEEAEITVAKTVPFLTRQETSTAGLDYSNYEYKDVGVTLNITPQINQERFVRLKISQEVSQVITEESVAGLPTTRKRSAKTTVIVKDGNTLVIGGLIDETMEKGTYHVPCLGSIPFFGWLFKSVGQGREKTNLLVFLTPHIIENPAEAKKIYEEKKEQIDRVKEGVIKMYKRPDARDQASKDKSQG